MGEDNVIFLKYGYQKVDFSGNVVEGTIFRKQNVNLSS